MRHATVAGLTLFTLACFGEPARAETLVTYLNGNALYADCTEGNARYCTGYIIGIVDAAALFKALAASNKNDPILICTPDDATQGQVRDVVIRWLEENPEQRHLAAPSLVLEAIFEKFTCD